MALSLSDRERFLLLAFFCYLNEEVEPNTSVVDVLEQKEQIILSPKCVAKSGRIATEITISQEALDHLRPFEQLLKTSNLDWRPDVS